MTRPRFVAIAPMRLLAAIGTRARAQACPDPSVRVPLRASIPLPTPADTRAQFAEYVKPKGGWSGKVLNTTGPAQ